MYSPTRVVRRAPRRYLPTGQARRLTPASAQARSTGEEASHPRAEPLRALGPYETSYEVQHGYGVDRVIVIP